MIAALVILAGLVAPQGSTTTDHWAFAPIRKAPAPVVNDTAWPRTDVDRFVRAAQEAKGLDTAPDANRRTLIRRVTFDLTGLPPRPEDVEAFVADESPGAFERVVDRLLASPRFGERWGRHWLDVVRYAESTGRTRNFPFPVAWRYRDYVIDAFNADTPYDRFITEQLAGDLMPETRDRNVKNRRKIATGFLAIGTKDLNERNAAQYKMDQVDDQMDVTSRAFMALTVSCARCHDHKFDPIPTRDYYALAGIFSSSTLLDGYANRKRGNNGYVQPTRYHSLELDKSEMAALTKTKAPAQAGGKKNARRRPNAQQQQAQRRLTQINAQLKRLAEARKQIPKNNRAALRKNRQQTNRLRKQQRQLAGQVKKKRGRRGNAARKITGNEAMGVRDHANPEDVAICIRGDVGNRGERVPRGVLTVFDGVEQPEIASRESGRLQLAQWLGNPAHPLTSRVIVNRIWHYLFGAGLVRTVDNFGVSGEKPSHPELLDWLARELIADGWSIKTTIKKLVMSRVYGLASTRDDASFEIDPDNRLLWRMSPRRLEAEALRDAMLAVSGQLDLARPKASPVMTLPQADLGRRRGAAPNLAASNHRSVYLPIVRNDVPGVLGIFDFAEPSTVTGRRSVTTVATQALYLMNSSFVVERSRHSARRLRDSGAKTTDEMTDAAYRIALGRPATDIERERIRAYVGDYEPSQTKDPWPSVIQAIFASAEFRYVR